MELHCARDWRRLRESQRVNGRYGGLCPKSDRMPQRTHGGCEHGRRLNERGHPGHLQVTVVLKDLCGLGTRRRGRATIAGARAHRWWTAGAGG
eukprot:3240553-Prymnesium_polylepis.1